MVSLNQERSLKKERDLNCDKCCCEFKQVSVQRIKQQEPSTAKKHCKAIFSGEVRTKQGSRWEVQ